MSIVDSLTLGIQSECPRGNEVRCCLLEPGGGKLHGSSLAVGASRKAYSARRRSRPRAVRRHSVLPLFGVRIPPFAHGQYPYFWLRLVILMGLVLPFAQNYAFLCF